MKVKYNNLFYQGFKLGFFIKHKVILIRTKQTIILQKYKLETQIVYINYSKQKQP